MDIVKPREPYREVKRIVMLKQVASSLSLAASLSNETAGFAYGRRIGDTTYLVSFLPHLDSWGDNANKTVRSFEFNGKDGRIFIKKHNQIVAKMSEQFTDFSQVLYHSHPKFNLEDLTKKERGELENFIRSKNSEDLERALNLIENDIPSRQDFTLARKYSSDGLALLCPAGRFEVRNLKDDMDQRSAYFYRTAMALLYEVPTPVVGFQTYQDGNHFPVPVIIAEESANYRDEETAKKVQKDIQPATNIIIRHFKNPDLVISRTKTSKFQLELMKYLRGSPNSSEGKVFLAFLDSDYDMFSK